jgi:hypothetical protein
MAAKLTRLTHEIAILHLVEGRCSICSSRSRRPVREVPDTLIRIGLPNEIITGAHTAPYPMGTMRTSLGIKVPGRKADHSPLSSAEVKNV